MKNQKVILPKIIVNDSYLVPYQDVIIKRINKVADFKEQLVGSISDFANGYQFFGLHKTHSGWIFREWAPNVTRIVLIGTFSNWEESSKYELKKVSNTGVWEVEVPSSDINHLDLYKLRVYWADGSAQRIPSYAKYVVQDQETNLFNACVWDPKEVFDFKHKTIISDEPPIIYEAHIGMAQIEGKVSSYMDFIKYTLPRIKKAGYNTLQLMAIQEHPYYGSFGYQVSNFFAPSSRFGNPDDLKRLIDAAHSLGLRVIMDIVHSHAVKNENEGLSFFDGTQFQYFHAGEKGRHPAWDTMCFNYGKDEVVHFLLSNCKYWLEEFKFDGFRFDGVTSMLFHHHGLGTSFGHYDDYFGDDVDEDAIAYLTLANELIHEVNNDAITIAEDVSSLPGIGVAVADGGVGFNFRLGMGLPDYWIKLLKKTLDENWNMGEIWHNLTNLRFDEKVIAYGESHDQALVGDKTLIFRLIDKDMYTNMEISNRNIAVDRGIAIHKLIRSITLATSKGGYLNFMGNEFGHPEWIDFPREGNDWSYHYARRQWDLVDNQDLCYRFLSDFDRDLILFVRENKLLNKSNLELILEHNEDKILAFKRNELLWIFNFHSNKSYEDYHIASAKGSYQAVFNSDEVKYGGFDRVDQRVVYKTFKGDSFNYISTYLPTRTLIVFKKL